MPTRTFRVVTRLSDRNDATTASINAGLFTMLSDLLALSVSAGFEEREADKPSVTLAEETQNREAISAGGSLIWQSAPPSLDARRAGQKARLENRLRPVRARRHPNHLFTKLHPVRCRGRSVTQGLVIEPGRQPHAGGLEHDHL